MIFNSKNSYNFANTLHTLCIFIVLAWSGYSKISFAAQTIPLSTSIYELIADPNRPFVYGSDSKHSQILIISATTRKVVKRITVGAKPTDMDFNIDGTLLYVANAAGRSISVIDLNTQVLVDTIVLAFTPSTVVAGRANRIYAGGCTEDTDVRNEIAIMDTNSHTEIGRFAGSVVHASTSDGLSAFVTEGCGFSFPNVRKWDISTDSPSIVIEDNLWGGGCNWDEIPQLVLSPDDSNMFLASGTTNCGVNNNGVLPIINSNTFLKTGELNIEYQPIAVSIDETGTKAYAAHNSTLINAEPGVRHDRLRKDIHVYNAQMFTESPHLGTSDSVASRGIASDEDNLQVFAVVGDQSAQNIDVICTGVGCTSFINTIYQSGTEETSIDLQVYVEEQASAFNLYTVCIATADVPTASDIKAGRKNSTDLAEASDSLMGITGNSHQMGCTGLMPNTEYTAYAVVETTPGVFSNVFSESQLKTLEQRDTSTNFTIPLNTSIAEIVSDPTRPTIYVADAKKNALLIINRVTRQIENELPLGREPVDIDLSKDSSRLYVAAGNTLVTIDLNTRLVVDTLELSFSPSSIAAGRTGRVYASQSLVGYPSTNQISIIDIDNKLELGTFSGNTVHASDSTGEYLYTSADSTTAPRLEKWDISTDTPTRLLGVASWGGGCGRPLKAIITADDANLFLVSGRSSCGANDDGKIPSISPVDFVKTGEITLDWSPLAIGVSQDGSTIVAAHYDSLTNPTPRDRHDRLRQDLHVFDSSLIEGRHLETSDFVNESGIVLAPDGSEVFAVVGLPGDQNIDVRCLAPVCTPITNTVYPASNNPTSLDFDLVVNTGGAASYDTYTVCIAGNDVPSPADVKAGRKNASDNADSATSMINVTGNTVQLSCNSLDSLTEYTIYAVIETDSLSQVFQSTLQRTQILRDLSTSKTVALDSSIHAVIADPVRPYVYATDSDSNQVHFINSASGVIDASVFVGSRPTDMALSQDQRRLYVAISGGSSIAVIDLEAQSALPAINLTFSPSAVVAGRTDRIYVGGCNEDSSVRDEIVMIDTITALEVGRFEGAIPHAADAAGDNIYVTEGCGFSNSKVTKWDVSTDIPVQLLKDRLWGGCGWETIPQALLSPNEASLYMVGGYSCSHDNGLLPFYDTNTFARIDKLKLDYTSLAGAISLNGEIAAFSHLDELVNATPRARHDRLRKDIHIFDGPTLRETPHIATTDFVGSYGLAITPSANQIFAVVGPNGSQDIDIRCLVEHCANAVEQIEQVGENQTTLDFMVSVIDGGAPYDLYAVCTQTGESPTENDIKSGRINSTTPAEGSVSALSSTGPQQSLSCGSLTSTSEFTVHAVAEISGVGFTPVFSQNGLSTNDGDTIAPELDNCPNLPNQDQADFDSDGSGDECDADDDNDGVADISDGAILNPMACRDLDADTCDDCNVGVDGLGPLADFNTANDGDDNEGDGLCDLGDPNDDNDTLEDENDNCPRVDNESQANLDGDDLGDACDADIDGDGVLNAEDSDDTNPLACADTDFDQCDDCSSGVFDVQNDGLDNEGDGLCDLGDPNDDGDTLPDDSDNCPFISNELQTDLDADGLGDDCDGDADGDTITSDIDSDDLNPLACLDTDTDLCDDCSSGTFSVTNDGLDTDADGQCNLSDLDDDNDLVPDELDNCPLSFNPDQLEKPCEDELCVPIKTQLGNVAVICL